MFAAGKKGSEYAQIRVGKQPPFSLLSGSFCSPYDGTKVFAASNSVKVLHADSGQTGNFFVGEDLLTRFDGDHRFSTSPNCP
jgi:hypothetical protein